MELLKEIVTSVTLNEKAKNVSFFTMTDIKKIEKLSVDDAKKIAVAKVEAATKAKPENKQKALKMITNSKSVINLMTGMTNFLLSAEDLKVVK